MKNLSFVSLLLLSGCATQQYWHALRFTGQTIAGGQPLPQVEIYRQNRHNIKRRLISKSDAQGNFDLKPVGETHTCILLGCMGDYASVRGTYIFSKVGYVDATVPFEIAPIGETSPGLNSRTITLLPGNR